MSEIMPICARCRKETAVEQLLALPIRKPHNGGFVSGVCMLCEECHAQGTRYAARNFELVREFMDAPEAGLHAVAMLLAIAEGFDVTPSRGLLKTASEVPDFEAGCMLAEMYRNALDELARTLTAEAMAMRN